MTDRDELAPLEALALMDAESGRVRRALDGRLPLSVKTRTGFSQVDTSWIEFLLGHDLWALIIHGRTKTQIRVLDDRARTHEVARMVSGAKVTDTSLQHAAQMIAASR